MPPGRSKDRTDRALLASTVKDGSGFGEFYARHERSILLFMLRRTREPELAADLTAEVFAAALAGVRAFEGRTGASPHAWLFGIARNVLAESYRRARVVDDARRRLELERATIDGDVIDELARLGDFSAGGAAMRFLDSLPRDQRDAVRAYVLDERDYPDIAAELRCSEAVVRKRVSRGLSTLRNQVTSRE